MLYYSEVKDYPKSFKFIFTLNIHNLEIYLPL